MSLETDLRESLRPVVEEAGLYLEEVRMIRAGVHSRLDVVVDLADGPGGVTDTQLAEATRLISARLDELDPIRGTYTLEVTTPGIERPLQSPRHFRRALGHTIEIVTADGREIRGKLLEVGESDVTVAASEPVTVAFADVASAAMVIDW